MSIKAALIDFDGTLADSMPFWLDLPRSSFRRAGIEPPADFDRRIRSVPMWELARLLPPEYPELTADGPLEEQWCAAMTANYRDRISLKPGAAELLKELREMGLEIVILSATRYSLLLPALDHHGVAALADRVYSEEEAGSKHSPDAYNFCASRLGLLMDEMLLLDDAVRNISAAAELGLATAGVFDESMAAWQETIRRIADVYMPDLMDRKALKNFIESRKKA